ncbi:hypothetical protein E3U36_10605 [Arsenophonus endosymbiont of Aphis craccivora]|uniref:hypothetical protein n=1 Tax=Arsenophonus endosymbiont of Aphis craccivora TaxID=1231049 RepID=UPI0015DC2EC4|nr:hypothetical protein [Arsenophonus endosymbiont of Aphis craccivora]QLK88382.1 hypothetical protein E3U36_10605 [Arsenophonus endosymbiont of Aphis craccivora]
MPWGPDVETNLAISSANHLKVRFIQQSQLTVENAKVELNKTYAGLKRWLDRNRVKKTPKS